MPHSAEDDTLNGIVTLVIEDDAMQLMAMQMLLESWGCVVLPAASARAAEKAIDDGGHPAIIISDFRLPENVSGMEAVSRVREMLGHPVPAVLQTGDTDPALVREAHARGFSMLHKPYDPHSLRDLMIRQIGTG